VTGSSHFRLAQRARCAAAIRSRASGLRVRFFLEPVVAFLAAGLLRPFLLVRSLLACSSLLISASISEIKPFVSISHIVHTETASTNTVFSISSSDVSGKVAAHLTEFYIHGTTFPTGEGMEPMGMEIDGINYVPGCISGHRKGVRVFGRMIVNERRSLYLKRVIKRTRIHSVQERKWLIYAGPHQTNKVQRTAVDS